MLGKTAAFVRYLISHASGRPHILCNEAEVDAITRVNQSPRSLKKVLG